MLTSRLRNEQGIALVTTIVLTAVMLVLGTAILGVVVTQAQQTSKERSGEAAFNLAEATLNAEAFLLGRNWPTTSVAGTCDANTLTGTLTSPGTVASPSLTQQVQSILAQTYDGSGSPTASQWHVTACAEGARNSWDASLLNGPAYDNTASSVSGPRRMWVRAEAEVDGRKRAVVGLVQAGKQPVFPSNLAVVAGKMGADVTTTTGQAVTGNVVGPLLTNLIGGSGKVINGNVGLRCSILDATPLGVTNCLSGIYKATSMTTVAPLLQANNFVDFASDQTISSEQVALLRQQAKASGTYYPNTSSAVGGVANGASCLPSSPSPAGKVIFIEQVGNGTGHCIINTTGNPSAAAVVVGSGGVRVCSNASCASASSGGTFTGVIYALHRKAPLQSNWADVRIEGGSKVSGGVFTDDNSSLAAAYQHGFVDVIPPKINLSTVISNLPLCQGLVGAIVCGPVLAIAGGPVDAVVNLLATLGVNATALAAAILPQLNASLPAITYNPTAVTAITTMGDSALVPGTFREVRPKF